MDNIASITKSGKCDPIDPTVPNQGKTDVSTQLVLSLALGVSAFVGFCILRPKWKSLYAARKRQSDAAAALPELPDTFFGWLPVLYKVTEQQVLASAGLDAYVFLAFFRMSIKLFGTMFVLACAVLLPINAHFGHFEGPTGRDDNETEAMSQWMHPGWTTFDVETMSTNKIEKEDTSYVWAYLVFTYFFTGLAVYFITRETQNIIKVRQDYLGSQLTITDRTIRLSGIPRELRSEDKIKQFLEKLEIGKVESVTLCRDWSKLDALMEKRMYTLRKLEEAWTVHLGNSKRGHIGPPRQQSPSDQNEEDDAINGEHDTLLGENHITTNEKPRPTTRIWYGFLNLQNKKVDAIDYFEEQLRKLDDTIVAARKKEYKPVPLAFVTMDSIPACQMAVQAVLDPKPSQLQTKLSPAPIDVVWQNTYLSRSSRMIRSWTITIFILVLSIFWLIPVAALAGLVNICSIREVWKGLADALESNAILASLVKTGLPTLIFSLLNVAVPFLYDYLANMQGMISQGDVELSVISKNFFFTFFNFFLVFTAFGTASNFWPVLRDGLRDTTYIASKLADSVKALGWFYINFILLQSIGLLPFRLLEFGSVTLYPIMLMGSKTPRDYAELVQPPVFKYGFYLPSALLVWILCTVYSVLPVGWMVLFVGILYFTIGYYTYKYQLLYAMDHPQHATGRAWPMICYRLMVGLGVFQLVMLGFSIAKTEFFQAGLLVPLLAFTVWFSFYYEATYEPLTKFIALRSIRRESGADINIADERIGSTRRRKSTLDEDREKGLKFINPSLTIPLEKLWIDNSDPRTDVPELDREESTNSSLSLGDTHVWRENGDGNV